MFAREGADVAITYNTDADGARETARRVEAAGRRCLVIQDDVGDPASVEATFAKVAAEFGVLDILVNNAGQAMSGMPVAEMDDGKLEQILRVNLMGPVFCARAFIKVRRAHGGRGKIVIVSSVAQHLPTPESAPYGMSKAGVGSLCRSLSRELAEDKINVNNVAPGLIETPMTSDRFENPGEARSLPRTHPVAPRRPARRHRQGDPLPRLGRRRLRHRPYPRGGWRPDHAMGRRVGRVSLWERNIEKGRIAIDPAPSHVWSHVAALGSAGIAVYAAGGAVASTAVNSSRIV